VKQKRDALEIVDVTGGKYCGLKAKVLGYTKKMVRLQLVSCKGEVRIMKRNINVKF